MVYYNNDEMRKFQREYERCNEEILEAMQAIDYEFENIEEILETPKSRKEIPDIISLMHEEMNVIKNEEMNYIDKLNYIMGNYDDKINTITTMVGDNNE